MVDLWLFWENEVERIYAAEIRVCFETQNVYQSCYTFSGAVIKKKCNTWYNDSEQNSETLNSWTGAQKVFTVDHNLAVNLIPLLCNWGTF